MRPADEVKREIAERYNADPRNWQVLVGKDPRGYYDLFVSHGSELWVIKERPLDPLRSVGIGLRERLKRSEVIRKVSPHPFGLRPLSEEDVSRTISAMRKRDSINDVIRNIMKIKPVSSERIESPVVVQGPMVYSRKPIELISRSQRKLSSKLGEELERMLLRKYPDRTGMYL